jgi:hypothetical protein
MGSAGTYDFGNGVVVASQITGSVLLVEYDSSGVPQWAHSATSAGVGPGLPYHQSAACYSVAVDPSSNVFAAGAITGTGLFDFGNNVTATGPNLCDDCWGAILVKYR